VDFLPTQRYPRLNRAALLPILGYAGYPLAIAGGLLIFGTCSLLTLNMITANMVQVASPVAASPDFNVPPVEQIGSLTPPPAAAAPQQAATPAEPESSIVAVAPPQQTFSFDVAPADGTVAPTDTSFDTAAPADTSFDTVEPPGLGAGLIGGQAVNVRAAPSRTGVVLGVLNAGSSVRTGENVGGWVHVYFEGGDGWVYESYLAGG
jgi:hypothetical protein